MLREKPGGRFAQLGLFVTIAATAVGVGVLYVYLTLADRQTPSSSPMHSGAGANPLHVPFGVLTLVGFSCFCCSSQYGLKGHRGGKDRSV